MSSHHTSAKLLCGLIASMVIVGTAASAAEPPAAPPEPTKQMRAKMASVHERMAACLRSDTAIGDCRSEMMKSCHEIMGERGCPMMAMGMHHEGMKGPPASAPKDK